MKLRLAEKIVKRIGTPDERRYTGHQTGRALARTQKTATEKEMNRWFDGLCRDIYRAAKAGDPVACRLMLGVLTDMADTNALEDDLIDRLIEETAKRDAVGDGE
jgi:transcriptional/translational regulatory protein YebC/TACO1